CHRTARVAARCRSRCRRHLLPAMQPQTPGPIAHGHRLIQRPAGRAAAAVAMKAPLHRRPRSRILAVFRVLVVLGLCSLLTLWWLLRASRASAADVLAELSDQLMQLP